MSLGKDMEHKVARPVTLNRSAGTHMIITTQRPAPNVITLRIKVNINGILPLSYHLAKTVRQSFQIMLPLSNSIAYGAEPTVVCAEESNIAPIQ